MHHGKPVKADHATPGPSASKYIIISNSWC